MSNIKFESRKVGSGIDKFNSSQKAKKRASREDRQREKDDAAARAVCREVSEVIGICALSTIASAVALPIVGPVGAFGVGAAACSAIYIARRHRSVRDISEDI